MNRRNLAILSFPLSLGLLAAGCSRGKSDPQAEAPPPLRVAKVEDRNVFQVDHPERFQLAQAVEHIAAPQLRVTGTVNPDILRAVPVISLAVGRVVEIHARLGDTVKKGQVLLTVQSADISGAFSDYQKAVADEQLAHTQLERAKLLFDKGAISQNDLQIAQNAEDKAKVDVTNTAEKLRVLGSPVDRPSGLIEIRAPISGVITDQQVTNAAGVAGLSSPNPFTISDLSHVWVLCDVYENDLVNVRLGDQADIRLNAYPDRALKAQISNISPMLDPNLRTAKVRLEMDNPGVLRFGMFVTATFHGRDAQMRSTVPSTAVLHLHDRQWVYTPSGTGTFKRLEVVVGNILQGNMQEIVSGIKPGDKVVANALVLQDTVEK